MAPTEGRVARPERRWGCRRGTPISLPSTEVLLAIVYVIGPTCDVIVQ